MITAKEAKEKIRENKDMLTEIVTKFIENEKHFLEQRTYNAIAEGRSETQYWWSWVFFDTKEERDACGEALITFFHSFGYGCVTLSGEYGDGKALTVIWDWRE